MFYENKLFFAIIFYIVIKVVSLKYELIRCELVELYHDAEGETGDDGVFNGEGGKVKSANVTREGLSDGAEGVLTDAGEDGGAGEVP